MCRRRGGAGSRAIASPLRDVGPRGGAARDGDVVAVPAAPAVYLRSWPKFPSTVRRRGVTIAVTVAAGSRAIVSLPDTTARLRAARDGDDRGSPWPFHWQIVPPRFDVLPSVSYLPKFLFIPSLALISLSLVLHSPKHGHQLVALVLVRPARRHSSRGASSRTRPHRHSPEY